MKRFFGFVSAVLLCEFIGSIGSLFTMPAIPIWYATLTRPALNPPNWVFGPVWTTLFALMGIALYLIWEQRQAMYRKTALIVFAVQFALNVLWSFIFFGMHRPGLATIEIAFLWLAIAATIYTFAKVSRAAALLLVPYLAWVSFASYLTYSIWSLNS